MSPNKSFNPTARRCPQRLRHGQVRRILRIEIPYGEEGMIVEVEDSRVAGVFEANHVSAGDEFEILKYALANPVGCLSLPCFLKDTSEILVIVNDATRPTPTARVLQAIYNSLKTVKIQFLIATGAHRPPAENEYREIFGKYLDEFRPVIHVHNARTIDDMVFVGRTQRGTDLYINKMVMEAKKIIVIGSVEPHYFAGYTGGRKAFLPGTAAYKTIEQNHKLALKPDSKSLVLEGNPVHEDMQEAFEVISKAKDIFSIMVVLDKNQRIFSAQTGSIDESFKAAVEKAREVFVINIPEKTDIVVTVARHPLDIDLYQSQKALDNGWQILKPGGIIILVSKCRCGIGDDTFLNLLTSCRNPKEVHEKIEEGYVLGYHKAAKMAEVMQHGDVYGVTGLPDGVLHNSFILPFPSLQKALDQALEIKGKEARVIFFLDGAMTVPALE
jgi:lactate racemase